MAKRPNKSRKSVDLDPNQSQRIMKIITKEFHLYCANTSLHGLQYLGDHTLTLFERSFWLVMFILSTLSATYFIMMVYSKYITSPIIITYSSKLMTVKDLPFPALTICNVNRADKSEVEKINSRFDITERTLLNDLCLDIPVRENFSYSSLPSVNSEAMKSFIEMKSQSCEKLLRYCRWKLDVKDCKEIFRKHITDDGLCCSFNRLPKYLIYKNSTEEKNVLAFNWSPQYGFPANKSKETLPWQSKGPGAHFGLTFAVDADVSNFYCSSTFGYGFKIFLSTPLNTPRMSDFGVLIRPGYQTKVLIKPFLHNATHAVKDIPVSVRRCYFPDEKYLRYYRIYTQKNCKHECLLNLTKSQCNCFPYYLNFDGGSVCRTHSFYTSCVKHKKELIEDTNSSTCGCLPSCFGIVYRKELSYAKLSLNETKHLLNTAVSVNTIYYKNITEDYVRKNIAIIQLYFVKNDVRMYLRNEFMSFSELLSSIGGLLGLFLGFSFLSGVEILYHITLKIFCKVFKPWPHTNVRRRNIPYYN